MLPQEFLVYKSQPWIQSPWNECWWEVEGNGEQILVSQQVQQMELDILKQWDECPVRNEEREMWEEKKEKKKTLGMQINEGKDKKKKKKKKNVRQKCDVEWLRKEMKEK